VEYYRIGKYRHDIAEIYAFLGIIHAVFESLIQNFHSIIM
jgi:(p)ppGpp synthase/HD superfamily hydrolase